jgi:hypothetical protein
VLVNCSAPGHEDVTQRLISKTQTSGVVGPQRSSELTHPCSTELTQCRGEG